MKEKPVMAPTHPGVILRGEFLEPMGVSEYRLAKTIAVSEGRISAITHGRRGISGMCEGLLDGAAGRL